MKRQRTETIGLVLGDVANPYATELARAVRKTAAGRGYYVFICVSEHSAKEEVAAFEAFADHRVDDIIVATRSTKFGDENLASLIESGIAVALIGRDFHHSNADWVAADNHAGGFIATQHLIDLGHTNIGFIGTNLTGGAGVKRFRRYLDALKQNGLEVNERFISGPSEIDIDSPGYSTEELGYEAMKRLLVLPQRPTAVFAKNDFTAIGAITAINEAGLDIPNDIAIVGFDDIPMATHTAPPLTLALTMPQKTNQVAFQVALKINKSN